MSWGPKPLLKILEQKIDDFNSTFYIEMVIEGSREVRTEYLIYDPLTFIGSVGGTLGLFVGFSIMQFPAMMGIYKIIKVLK